MARIARTGDADFLDRFRTIGWQDVEPRERRLAKGENEKLKWSILSPEIPFDLGRPII